jgi:hypothetical protein
MKKVSWSKFDLQNPNNSEFGEGFQVDFNCYICETNFPIKRKNFVPLSKIEGLEGISPVSRYKLIVGFGNLFDEDEVKSEVESCLLSSDNYLKLMNIKDEETRNLVKETAKELQLFKHWSLVVIPNGSVKTATSDDIGEFNLIHKEIEQIAKKCNGIIIRG